MLKIIRIVLLAAFAVSLAAAAALYLYKYNHEDVMPPVFRSAYGPDEVLEVSVDADWEDLCKGLRAFDNIDGEITDRILVKSISQVIENATVRVTYVVFDDASNYASFSRLVRYTDYTPPRYSLKKPMIFSVGETVTFLDRISAIDAREGDITGRITLSSSNVNSGIAGTYDTVLTVSNRMGDTVDLPLTVIITNKSVSMPSIALSDYLIYLPRDGQLDAASYLRSVNDPLSAEAVSLSEVRINDSELDASTPGVYEIKYFYTGLSGDLATVILTVVVE